MTPTKQTDNCSIVVERFDQMVPTKDWPDAPDKTIEQIQEEQRDLSPLSPEMFARVIDHSVHGNHKRTFWGRGCLSELARYSE